MSFFNKKSKISEDILKVLNERNRFKRYSFLTIGCFLLAFAFNVFYSPNNLVTGGVSGISIVVNNVFGVSTSTFITVTYLILLVLSYLILGKETTKYSLIGSILYPLFVYLTKDMVNLIQFNVDNMLLIALFGALINGIGAGLTFKYGFSTGGSDIICQIISKYFKISMGNAIKVFNFIIIVGSGFFITNGNNIYAWENVMYAIIAVYISTFLTDKVLLGISSSKSFYVITEHETAIKNFLMNELGKGVTVLEGRGGYTGDRKKVLMCVIPTKEYYLAKEGILEIDKNAIVLINDVYQSSGIE
ncbi:MAG: YitT family protein [Firmicutes bacterium]|nr:YitT family protein [Bacillota bacterium]